LKRPGIEAKTKRDTAERDIAAVDDQIRAGLEIRRRLAQDEQSLSQIEENRARLPNLNAGRSGVEARLNSGDFAVESRSELKPGRRRDFRIGL